jgi:hypothetical protein
MVPAKTTRDTWLKTKKYQTVILAYTSGTYKCAIYGEIITVKMGKDYGRVITLSTFKFNLFLDR